MPENQVTGSPIGQNCRYLRRSLLEPRIENGLSVENALGKNLYRWKALYRLKSVASKRSCGLSPSRHHGSD